MKNCLRKIMLLVGLLALNLGAKAQSYCTPAYTYGCAFGDQIDGFVLNGELGTSINHSATGCSPGSYGDYTAMSATLVPGALYGGQVIFSGTGLVSYRLWVDANNDGTFDASELLLSVDSVVASGAPTGSNFTMYLPTSTTPGTHRLRLRLIAAPTSGMIDPCISYDSGETHDYTVFVPVTMPGSCAGPGGAAVSSVTGDSVIAGVTPFTLSVTGGPAGTGLFYSWAHSIDSGVSWNPMPPSASMESMNVPYILVPTCYMRITHCGIPSPYVNSYMTCMTLMSFISAYPKSGLGGGCGAKSINKVSITGSSLHNSSACATTAGSGIYNAWPNADSFTTTVYKDVPFELKVSTGNDGAPAQMAAWIDYNQNGAFDATEFTLIAASSPSNTAGDPTALFSAHTITIPATAFTGLTKMRIRTRAASAASFTDNMAQASLPDGETEDYFITILEAGPCDTPVVSLGADTMLCPGTVLTLDAGNPGKTHNWNTGAGTQSIVVSSPGTYLVTVVDGACSDTDSIVISTVPEPQVDAIIISGVEPDYNFVASGVSGASSVMWYFGDGATANTPVATHTYAANGTYDVMFLATNTCGHSDTAIGFVTVESLDIGSLQSGVAGVAVYPNPANSYVTVQAKDALINELEVTDYLGRSVLHTYPQKAEAILNIKHLSQGIYTLRVHTTQGSRILKLVIKQ